MVERGPISAPPRGKELINRGLDKVVSGVFLTAGNEIVHGVKFGIVGAMIGVPAGFISGNVIEGVKTCATLGANIGVLWGWHSAHGEFNKDAAKNGNPPVRWYDWLGATIIKSNIDHKERPFNRSNRTEQLLWGQLFNPTSTSGMKDVLHGGFQVVFG
ncbi:hypothetical protein HZB58_05655 [Candidatus Gottesmanbacteria bacterium]|nr:hypothetical protein [Candidatus Gottesmanbacteria bacterium]